MSNPTPYAPPRRGPDLDVLREVAGIVLILLGVVGLSVVAVSMFLIDWRLGVASVSFVAIATGAFLGYQS